MGLPSAVEPGDIYINEILFNPRTGSSDYIELINVSEKILDIGEWLMANEDENEQLINVTALPQEHYLFPSSYLALTMDVEDVRTQYPDPHRPGEIIESDMVSMPNTEGTIILYRNDFPDIEILDRLDYLDDYHNPLLGDLNGVALERLSTSLVTNLESNWSSAAGSAGFGTPAAPNSQQLQELSRESENPFDLGEARLSPDDDGFEDFLAIRYQDEGADFVVSLRIYNTAGQLIKVLANNRTVGNEALFRWDGDTHSGSKAPVGIYILWAERFNPQGVVERFKESIVVAAQLD